MDIIEDKGENTYIKEIFMKVEEMSNPLMAIDISYARISVDK